TAVAEGLAEREAKLDALLRAERGVILRERQHAREMRIARSKSHGIGEVPVAAGLAGRPRPGLLECALGLIDPAERLKRGAEPIVSVDVAGLEDERLAVMAD